MKASKMKIAVVSIILSLSLVPAASAETYYVQPVTTVSQHFASEIDRLIDVQRAKYYLPAYTYSACAYKYANLWSVHLASTSTLYHQNMANLWYGCNTTRAGETLARRYNHATTLVNAWMASPIHRVVLLDRQLKKVGVSARYANGQWTVAADYIG